MEDLIGWICRLFSRKQVIEPGERFIARDCTDELLYLGVRGAIRENDLSKIVPIVAKYQEFMSERTRVLLLQQLNREGIDCPELYELLISAKF